MVKCEFCDVEVHSMNELEAHLRNEHGFTDNDLEQYGGDRGLYFEAEFKKEGEG